MNSWLDFVLAALATYYVTISVTKQEGPFEVFLKLRNLATADTWVGRGIRCHICVSLYVSAIITLGLWLLGTVSTDWTWLIWLGLAGASVKIDEYWRR